MWELGVRRAEYESMTERKAPNLSVRKKEDWGVVKERGTERYTQTCNSSVCAERKRVRVCVYEREST